MFKEAISSTPFTSEAANDVMSNITGAGYNGDFSFISTLRALIYPRTRANITLTFGNSFNATINADDSAAANMRRIMTGFRSDYNDEIYIHNLCGSSEQNEVSMAFLESKFCEIYKSYKKLQEVSALFSKTFKVLCFVDAKKKKTVVIVDNLNLRKYHYLQCAILGLLPWYFDPKAGITADERDLVFSLKENTPDKYIECINRIAAQYNFEETRLRRLLGDFEKRFESREIEKLARSIERFINRINEYNETIGELIRDKRDAEMKLLGYKLRESEENESGILDYFLHNKRLYLDRVRNDDIYFTAADYISYYDEELVKRVLNNTRSYIYDYCGNGSDCFNKEQMSKLMKAVFIDSSVKLRFCAAYRFRINGSVEAQGGHDFPDALKEFMPNPHIQRYNCLGSHAVQINNRLSEGDYIGALEQCVASCKSLNWGDSAVMSEFCRQIISNAKSKKCFVLPDGTSATAMEVLSWLEKSNEAEEK